MLIAGEEELFSFQSDHQGKQPLRKFRQQEQKQDHHQHPRRSICSFLELFLPSIQNQRVVLLQHLPASFGPKQGPNQPATDHN